MDRDQILTRFDQQVRFESEDPLSDRTAWATGGAPADRPTVVRIAPLEEGARWGWVIWTDLDESTADAAIREQIAYFTERKQNFEWKRFAHDRPADLDQRLLRAGFVREEDETVMAYDLDNPTNLTGLDPELRSGDLSGFVVRKVTADDTADLHTVAQLETTIWGDSHDWIVTELGAELLLPGEPTVMYLALYDGAPAAAAWMRFYEGSDFAALFGGSTLPAYRNKGLYTALLQVRAQEARRRGYRYLTVDAGEMSRPILQKHGFIPITTAIAYKYYVAR